MNVFEINAEKLTPREINSQIKQASEEYDKIIIRNPNAKHYLSAGVTEDVEIEFDGSVGYFAGCMCEGPKIKINGNAGWFAGDNITGGEVNYNHWRKFRIHDRYFHDGRTYHHPW